MPEQALDVCYIDRSFNVDQKEAKLESSAVLVQVVGTRPEVWPQDALAAIAAQFNFDPEGLTLRRVSPPEDFLLELPDHASVLTVLQGDRMVHTPRFTLRLKPWSRLVNAEQGALYHKVLIELERLPLHVWDYGTAAELLSPFCCVESVDPETVAHRDFSTFRVVARTTRPEFIPESRTLAIPEPAHAEAAFEPVRLTLRYTVKIHVQRLLVRLPPDSLPASSTPTPPSGLPSDDDDSPDQNPKRRQVAHDRYRRDCAPPPAREDTPCADDNVAGRSFVHCSGISMPCERRRSAGSGSDVHSSMPSHPPATPQVNVSSACGPSEPDWQMEAYLSVEGEGAVSVENGREDPMVLKLTASVLWQRPDLNDGAVGELECRVETRSPVAGTRAPPELAPVCGPASPREGTPIHSMDMAPVLESLQGADFPPELTSANLSLDWGAVQGRLSTVDTQALEQPSPVTTEPSRRLQLRPTLRLGPLLCHGPPPPGRCWCIRRAEVGMRGLPSRRALESRPRLSSPRSPSLLRVCLLGLCNSISDAAQSTSHRTSNPDGARAWPTSGRGPKQRCCGRHKKISYSDSDSLQIRKC